MTILKPMGAAVAVLSLSSCIVAYNEAKARKEGLSGDPENSGFYQYDKGLAERENARMRQDLDAAEASRDARYAELSRLRSRLAETKARAAAARTAAQKEVLGEEIRKLEKQIIALEAAT